MSETTDNSSLPLLLSITGAVLLVAVGGWFYLEEADSAVTETAPPEPLAAMTEPAATIADLPDEPAPAAATPLSSDSVDVDAELRKARLAAGADILVLPRGQSALYYYGQVLAVEPDHALAIAELDAVVATLARTVSEQLEAESFAPAWSIASEVAKLRPSHPLVAEVQQTLDAITEEQVARAISEAQSGNDAEADAIVAEVAALPGRNPEYLSAVRDSIEEIREVRLAAERDRAARARLAENEAKAAWIDSVNSAIADGKLINPAGGCARDLLAEDNAWSTEREELTASLVEAIGNAAESSIDTGELDAAEALLDAAVDLTGDADVFGPTRKTLESAFIAAESARVARVAELVAVELKPARYPGRAEEKGLSGWVDVLFTVTPSGTTSDIEVAASQPETIFDRAATSAVEQWVFEPVEYRGQVISQRVAAKLKFELQ